MHYKRLGRVSDFDNDWKEEVESRVEACGRMSGSCEDALLDKGIEMTSTPLFLAFVLLPTKAQNSFLLPSKFTFAFSTTSFFCLTNSFTSLSNLKYSFHSPPYP